MQHDHILNDGAPQLALLGPGGAIALDRKTIEALADLFVGLLDIADIDPDLEHNAVEDEPSFDPRTRMVLNSYGWGPGCLITDNDHGAEEAGEQEEA